MSAARSTDEPTVDDAARPGSAAGWTDALGDFIRAQRQLARLTLREMAAMTSVSNAYLSQVERGLHQPSLKVLHAIAEALQRLSQLVTEFPQIKELDINPFVVGREGTTPIAVDAMMTLEKR